MGYSIHVLLIILAVFGHLSFPKDSMIAEATGKPITIAITVREPHISIAKEDSFVIAQDSNDKKPLLRMVIIRVRSSIEFKQLRQMNLDIVMAKPDPQCPPGEALFSGRVIVEAVVSAGQLAKLKKRGFEVTKIP